jgi:uncharacterized protein
MSRFAAIGLLALSLSASGQIVRHSNVPNVEEELGASISMRDGIRLAADIFRPQGRGRWPTVLVRTPYNRKAPAMGAYLYFLSRGYAVVIEDTRGRFASQGSFVTIDQEGPDGNDTINWISEQPWSNGSVGMVGSSYLGIVQWWAAIEDNPHLKAICPMNSGDDEYRDRFYSSGGALKLGHRLLWLAENFTPPAQVRPLLGSYIYHLPLMSADNASIGMPSSLWRTALSHPSYDEYWRHLSIQPKLSAIHVPVMSSSGWFDNYAESELDAFTRLSHLGKVVETWIGPWPHDPGYRFPTVRFGEQASIHFRSIQADWLDRWLKPSVAATPKVGGEPQLHLFVMGSNVWREEHEWPLARTQYRPLYLNSGGDANSSSGNGELSWQSVKTAAPDSFVYDPRRPVPTTGGAICCDARVLPPGPLDQSEVEQRSDVLVYTSEILKSDIEVTGPIRVVLYMATSANDTDATAKLVDVQSDGKPLLVTDGIQRLRYRLSLKEPVFVKRNTPYQVNIDAGVTSYVFFSGHRIRLEISSSNFPRFDRNLNTMHPNSAEVKMNTARQVIYHNQTFPSAVILPVIPRSHATHSDERAAIHLSPNS